MLLFLIHIFPLIILLPLIVLETGVAIIQAFVFTVLFCIYLIDEHQYSSTGSHFACSSLRKLVTIFSVRVIK